MDSTNVPSGAEADVAAAVQCWECPYCGEFSGETVEAVREHVAGAGDGAHRDVSGVDRHVPGYDGDGALVAVAPADGVGDRSVVPIEEVDSVPGTTEVVADAGSERLGVDRWVCPYCEEYTNGTEQGIRSHVTGTDDAGHAGKSGWNPDRAIEGYDADGDLVARITPATDGSDSVVVPAGEATDVDATAYTSGEGIRGEKKVRLINAWLADPDAHYSDLAAVADTTPRYAHRVKGKLEAGEIADAAVEDVADGDLQAEFARQLADGPDRRGRSPDPAQALSAAGVDPSRPDVDAPAVDGAAVPLSEVERVRDMMEMYRREAEFEADSATEDGTTGDAVLRARAETKEFVAGQAVETLEELIEDARSD